MIATAKNAEITPDTDANDRKDAFDPTGLFLASVASALR